MVILKHNWQKAPGQIFEHLGGFFALHVLATPLATFSAGGLNVSAFQSSYGIFQSVT